MKPLFKDSLDTPAKELPDRLEDLAGSSNDFGLELHPPLKPPSCLLSPLPANVMLTTWEMGAWVGGRGGWMGEVNVNNFGTIRSPLMPALQAFESERQAEPLCT